MLLLLLSLWLMGWVGSASWLTELEIKKSKRRPSRILGDHDTVPPSELLDSVLECSTSRRAVKRHREPVVSVCIFH